MKVTYFGTTMLLFDDGKTQLLFDCHVTRPSILQCLTMPFETDKKVADKVLSDYDFSRLKAMFISHSHHDHVLDAPYFANKTKATVYGTVSTLNVCRGGKVNEDQLIQFESFQSYQIDDFNITIIPSIHSKAHWYNNDLGQVIENPITFPANKKAFKEGGSYDFVVMHKDKTYIIRPSYNYLENQWDSYHCDVLFLGVGGLSKAKEDHKNNFFKETVDKLQPSVVIPVHWDNFFVPLFGPVKGMPKKMEDTELSLKLLGDYCHKQNIEYIIQQPLTIIEI